MSLLLCPRKRLQGNNMIDTNAPIIPGVGAANIKLGANIKDLQTEINLFSKEKVLIPGVWDIGVFRYRSPSVDLWEKNDVIVQIMVHSLYTGKLLGQVGIGSPVQDVERFIGSVDTEMEDYIVRKVPGFSFEPDVDTPTGSIAEIYVFEPDWTQK